MKLSVRTLEEGDYVKGFLDLLSQLSVVGEVSEEAFKERFHLLQGKGDDYTIMVIEDEEAGRVVACATLLVEHKFLRQCSAAGHIEDVVVDNNYRGHKLGQRLIQELVGLAEKRKCYKLLLDCSSSNVGFYEKCSFERKGEYMVKYFEKRPVESDNGN